MAHETDTTPWRAMEPLAPATLRKALVDLPGWTHEPVRPALQRRFVFPGFAQAFAFMTQMAIVSQRHDHHPEWSNVHRVVDVTLTTHDAGGISARDLAWARLADQAFAWHGASPATGV